METNEIIHNINKPKPSERYKNIRKLLYSQVISDKCCNAFLNETKTEEYSGMFTEDEKWWRILLMETNFSPSYDNYIEVGYILSNTIYMNKYKDLVVLKLNIVDCIDYWTGSQKNCIVVKAINTLLKEFGVRKKEFNNELKMFNKASTRMLKILIPNDMDAMKLKKLINTLGYLNKEIVKLEKSAASSIIPCSIKENSELIDYQVKKFSEEMDDFLNKTLEELREDKKDDEE